MAASETRTRLSAMLFPLNSVEESSVMLVAPPETMVNESKLIVSPPLSPMVMLPSVAVSVVSSAVIVLPAMSVMLPVADSTDRSPSLPVTTVPIETFPAVLARLMSLLSLLVLEASTTLAVMVPPASTVIEPSAVVTLVSVTASASLMSITPVPLTAAVMESASVSRSMPVAAVASRFAAVILVVAPFPSVIAPPAAVVRLTLSVAETPPTAMSPLVVVVATTS